MPRGDVTPARIDSLMLAGCGHPAYERVRAPALVIDAVLDSAPQLFPIWSSLGPDAQVQTRRFSALLQTWAGDQRARRRRALPRAEVLALHGANHYVFDSHRDTVLSAMRRFLATHH